MTRHILGFIFILFFSSCENTNIPLITGAATDAVTALTLSDEAVRDLATRAAYVADSQNLVAPKGSSYDKRLQVLTGKYSEMQPYTFNFKVYQTKDVNAFAMADGTIRVNSGLMDLMNDAELLFILGHEMGHVVQEHSRKKVVLAYASSALRKGLAAQENNVGLIARSMLGAFVERLTNAQFSQNEERQADQYGVKFLKAAGHAPVAAVSALEKLAGLAKQHTFLSSHPDPAARIKKLALDKEDTSETQDSLVDTLFKYGEMIVTQLFQLGQALVNWLLSLWGYALQSARDLTSVSLKRDYSQQSKIQKCTTASRVPPLPLGGKSLNNLPSFFFPVSVRSSQRPLHGSLYFFRNKDVLNA